MKWQVRFNRDGFSVDAAIEKGRALPEWYLDEPLSLPGDEVFLDGFWYLNTERYYGTGPIPVAKVESYAFRHGIAEDMIGSFVRILRLLDDAYLKMVNEEIERQREQTKTKIGGRFRRSRSRR